MLFYLDTSAMLKRYRTEKGTDVVDLLYASKRDLLTSVFGCVEVAAVASRALRGKVLDAGAHEKLMSAFVHDISQRMYVWPADWSVMWDAWDAAELYGLRAPDSVHLASAKQIQKETGDEEFFVVSSDQELLTSSRKANMYILDPEEDKVAEMIRERGL